MTKREAASHANLVEALLGAAKSGCSDDEIAAISGHASIAMIRKYAGAARQIMRARTANTKRGKNV